MSGGLGWIELVLAIALMLLVVAGCIRWALRNGLAERFGSSRLDRDTLGGER